MDKERDTLQRSTLQPLIGRIREAMAERSLSQNDVARQIDMSPSAVSGFLAERYKGDNAEMERKLTAWLNEAPVNPDLDAIISRIQAFTETPTSREILRVVRLAKSIGVIATVAATSGIGKSITLTNFRNLTPAVWYCQFSPDTKGSAYAVLLEVAKAVGIVEPALRPDALRRDIVARIEKRQGLLICDESQHLTNDGFETIRTLHDRAGTGILFAGHADLADRVAKLPQLDGRVSAPLRIAAAKAADVDALLVAWGCECSLTRDFLRQFAGMATGLRRIACVYKLAAIYAFGDGATVSFDHVQKAWNALNERTLAA